MKKIRLVCAAIILSSALPALALAQAQPAAGSSMSGNAMGSSMAGGSMGMSGPGQKMSKMDEMMVKNCKAMSHDKMMADAECQDYMKKHPDWMKTGK